MFFSLLFSQPAFALVWLIAILVSLTVHEFSHALASKWRGDLTAERDGRLSLNPLDHIDWLGFASMLLLGFGWAKPVPYNPYNLRDPKWDSVIIGLAGPASNIILAIFAGIIFRILLATNVVTSLNLLILFLILLIILNVGLALFNIIPIHPLDGSKLFFAIFSDPKYRDLRQTVAHRGPQILMVLIFISLLTKFNVFFFITVPAFGLCNFLIGGSCTGVLYSIF